MVSRIAVGLLAGVAIGALVQGSASAEPVGKVAVLLGSLFVGALKAVAPLLVFVLVMAAIARHREGSPTRIRPIIFLYVTGTFLAALVAVSASFLFPSQLSLLNVTAAERAAPGGIGEVLHTLLMKTVSNPVQALAEANYSYSTQKS